MRPNDRWTLDFVFEAFWTGRRFRALGIVDDCTRESPAILADFSIPGTRIVRLLDALTLSQGLPEEIVMNNGPELTSRAMFLRSQRTGVRLRFIEPGKPGQNAYTESFFGWFRDGCLNEHWFGSLTEARRTIEAWRATTTTSGNTACSATSRQRLTPNGPTCFKLREGSAHRPVETTTKTMLSIQGLTPSPDVYQGEGEKV